MRAMLSEYQMSFKMRPSILPVIQALLKNTRQESLGIRAQITALMALPADSPLTALKQNITRPDRGTEIDHIRAKHVAQIESVSIALDGIHREITGLVSAARAKQTGAHNRRSRIRPCKCNVGDYILWGTSRNGGLPKLTLRWKGLYQSFTVPYDFLFVIYDSNTGKQRTAHGTGLRFSRNSFFEVDEVCRPQLEFQDNEFWVVEEIIDIRLHKGEKHLLVK